jgi:hypothetical protein
MNIKMRTHLSLLCLIYILSGNAVYMSGWEVRQINIPQTGFFKRVEIKVPEYGPFCGYPLVLTREFHLIGGFTDRLFWITSPPDSILLGEFKGHYFDHPDLIIDPAGRAILINPGYITSVLIRNFAGWEHGQYYAGPSSNVIKDRGIGAWFGPDNLLYCDFNTDLHLYRTVINIFSHENVMMMIHSGEYSSSQWDSGTYNFTLSDHHSYYPGAFNIYTNYTIVEEWGYGKYPPYNTIHRCSLEAFVSSHVESYRNIDSCQDPTLGLRATLNPAGQWLIAWLNQNDEYMVKTSESGVHALNIHSEQFSVDSDIDDSFGIAWSDNGIEYIRVDNTTEFNAPVKIYDTSPDALDVSITADRDWVVFLIDNLYYLAVNPGFPATPTPLPNPPPTFTPLPECTTKEIMIHVSDTRLLPGDSFSCNIGICNPTNKYLREFPLYFVIEVLDNYHYGPLFTSEIDNYLDRIQIIPPGYSEYFIFFPFEWPEGLGSGHCTLHAALIRPERGDLWADIDTVDVFWY